MGDVQKSCHACNFIARVLLCTRHSKITAQHSSLSHPWMISLKGSRLRAFFGVKKSLRSIPKNHAHKGDVQKGCHACNFIARVLFCTRRRKTTAQHSSLSHPWMISLKGSQTRAFFCYGFCSLGMRFISISKFKLSQ